MPVMISSFSFLILCICAFVIVVLKKGIFSTEYFLCALVAWENWQRSAPVALRRKLKHGPGTAAGGEVILHLCAAAGIPVPMPADC